MEDPMTTPATAPTVNQPVTVPLRDIERELSRQMKALQGEGEAPVSRARMSNLVIFCSSREQGTQVAAQLPEVVSVHPARVLLLVGEPGASAPGGPGGDITATVHVR